MKSSYICQKLAEHHIGVWVLFHEPVQVGLEVPGEHHVLLVNRQSQCVKLLRAAYVQANAGTHVLYWGCAGHRCLRSGHNQLVGGFKPAVWCLAMAMLTNPSRRQTQICSPIFFT